MQIAVGGCLAQKDQGTITTRAPWVDVVFGTHNVGALPVLLERARVEQSAQVELEESLVVFPSTLPARRESTYSAWVSISVGCDNTCTFCIVPSLRGKEEDRRPGDVLREVEVLAAQGVLEVTLLGQNVNSYGRSFGDRDAFGTLLRAVGRDRARAVRFTSPHPRDFTDDVIAAMAETPAVCPSLHMPLQSGSDAVLKAMRRSYRSERFLGILDRVRAQIPTPRSPPTSSSASRRDRRRLRGHPARRRGSRFAGAFTFQYSPRPAPRRRPAAAAQGGRAGALRALVALQDRMTYDGMRAQVGRTVEVLVSRGRVARTPRPADRPRPRQPAGAPRPGRGGAPRRRRHDRVTRPARTTWWRRPAAVAPPHRRGRRRARRATPSTPATLRFGRCGVRRGVPAPPGRRLRP
jgi:tRNA-2-methylthio-N6-dimethylallyladenosine synthase